MLRYGPNPISSTMAAVADTMSSAATMMNAKRQCRGRHTETCSAADDTRRCGVADDHKAAVQLTTAVDETSVMIALSGSAADGW